MSIAVLNSSIVTLVPAWLFVAASAACAAVSLLVVPGCISPCTRADADDADAAGGGGGGGGDGSGGDNPTTVAAAVLLVTLP